MSAPTEPRVSVIIPVYNQEHHLRRAIDSILTQTLDDFELILIDDGSGPAAAAAVDEYARRDPRVVAEHKANGGMSSALNRGIELARANYVARLDGDDIATPDRLEKQVAFMESNPHVGIVGGQTVAIDANDLKIYRIPFPVGAEKLAATVMQAWVMASSAMLIRRDLLRELGGWRRSLDFVEDYDLLLRAVERMAIDNIADVVLYYRRHDTQISRQYWARMSGLTEIARAAATARRSGNADPLTSNDRVTRATLDLFPFSEAERARVGDLLENRAPSKPAPGSPG